MKRRRKHEVNLNNSFEIQLIPPRKQSVSITKTDYLITFMKMVVAYSGDHTKRKKINSSGIMRSFRMSEQMIRTLSNHCLFRGECICYDKQKHN